MLELNETDGMDGTDGTAGHGNRQTSAAAARLGRMLMDHADALYFNALMCAWYTECQASFSVMK